MHSSAESVYTFVAFFIIAGLCNSERFRFERDSLLRKKEVDSLWKRGRFFINTACVFSGIRKTCYCFVQQQDSLTERGSQRVASRRPLAGVTFKRPNCLIL